MLENIKLILGIADTSKDALITLYITMTTQDILDIMYPYGIPVDVTAVPAKYESVQILMVIFWYNTQGVEGQSVHSENGINRSYSPGGFYPNSLTSRIVTVAVTT